MLKKIAFYTIFVCLLLSIQQAFAVTKKELKNYTYYLSFLDEKITLKNGKYERGSTPDGYKKIELVKYKILDLNSDGIKDAVVILVGTYGGSGSFYELTALISDKKGIKQTNSVILGDRIKVEKISVNPAKISPSPSNTKIELSILTHRETDAQSTPTLKEVICYEIIHNELITPCTEPLNQASLKENKSSYSFLPNEPGEIIIRELLVKEHKILIRVNTNGCTHKNTIKAKVTKTENRVDSSVPNYEITFIRVIPDDCKASFPEGVMIEYDLGRDLEIETKLPYTFLITNPLYPFSSSEKYFIIRDVVTQTLDSNKDEVEKLKSNLIKATINAIELELKRYEESSHTDKLEKINFLKNELKRFKEMSTREYNFVNNQSQSTDPLADFGKFGPLMPPIEREVDIIVEEPIKVGAILQVRGMTKSGPFYHVAGMEEGIKKSLEKGINRVKIYLVYKREYFPPNIANYYVYLVKRIK